MFFSSILAGPHNETLQQEVHAGHVRFVLKYIRMDLWKKNPDVVEN